MDVQGSQLEGDGNFLVFVDELPSIRLEDAPDDVWAEARRFYGQQDFEITGTFEAPDRCGYTFSRVSDNDTWSKA
ncbi:hypothetical protein M1C57_20815 [Rhodococcus pyridinivorans]|uniref:hypothetical protein n=1 Tax=Rhodococcus pyridinivorans TaxID=103816 RepID=UPI00200B1138|nr:hypothetical protein [Rhodococcus pyridinivorans]UPW04034.1 hypothetical protein M1C57_20815 [Rhodococcus pyridinivorans]